MLKAGDSPQTRGWRRRVLASWLALLILTALLLTGLRVAHAPAAFMLGPLLAAVLVALTVPGARLPSGAAVAGQALLGCLIARTLTPDFLAGLLPDWPIMLGFNAALVGGIVAIGLTVTRHQWLPGTAGIWGASPGAATAMVLLADSHGSDKRLVAMMQYLRILCAALAVIAIGSIFGEPLATGPSRTMALPRASAPLWTAPVDGAGLAVTAGLILIALALSVRLRSPALAFFVPIIGGVAIQIAGAEAPAVPPLASAAAFGLIGWHVGLSFTRASLLHSARLLPRILLLILAILLLCGGLALLLARLADVSLLTAYMALNPGGIDAVLILASGIDVDLPLILAVQISRLVLVIALLPALSRWIAVRYLGSRPSPPAQDASGRPADEVDEGS